MSEEIIKVLNALAEKLGLAVNFTAENVIPYMEQLLDRYVNYKLATSAIWLVTGIICLFVSKWMLKKAREFAKGADWCYGGNGKAWAQAGCLAGFGCLVLIGIIVILIQTRNIVTCLTFPERIFFEELILIYSN